MHWEVYVTIFLLVLFRDGLSKPSRLIDSMDEDDPFTFSIDRIRRMMEGAMFDIGKNDSTQVQSSESDHYHNVISDSFGSGDGFGSGFQHIETKQIQILPDGSKKITTSVKKRDYDKKLKNFTESQKDTEIIKHANHSISLVVREGENGEDMETKEDSQVSTEQTCRI